MLLSKKTLNKILRLSWAFGGVVLAFFWVVLVMGWLRFYPLSFDLTQEKKLSLSEVSIEVLEQVDVPVRLVHIFDMRTATQVYERIESVQLMLHSVLSDFEYERVDSIREVAQVKAYADKYSLTESNVVVLEIGDRYKVLPYTKMANYDYSSYYQVGAPSLKELSVEKEIVSALYALSQVDQKTVVFLSGHGESSVLDNSGLGVSQLRSLFQSQNLLCDDQFSWEKLSSGQCDVLLILSPQKELLLEEQKALISFVVQGGIIILCLDPGSAFPRTFLDYFGVIVEDKVVVDPGVQVPFVPLSNLVITNYSNHPIVRSFVDQGVVTMFPLSAPLRVLEKPNLSSQVLLKTTGSAWASSKWRSGEIKKEEADLEGELPLVVLIEKKEISVEILEKSSQNLGFEVLEASESNEDPSSEVVQGKLIVCGDADFLVNDVISALGNRDLIASFVNGLVGQTELLKIDSVVVKKVRLSGTDQNFYRVMINVLTFGVAFFWLFLGVVVWSRRR